MDGVSDLDGVRLDVADRVATITLDRPEKRNALSLEMLEKVTKALHGVPADAGVVVLAAEGPAFSAGHDLGEMIDRPSDFYTALFAACTEMMESIHRIPQPVIARVHGPASAAGCQLVAGCDLAVAADTAWFATPGVRIGLFCSTPMVPISRAIGRKRAMQMLLTGDPIDAATAVDWGLINAAVPSDRLDAEVAALAAKIMRFSRDTIAIGKEAFYAQADLPETAAYDVAVPIMAGNASIADAQEGMSAFLEKRDPKWRASGA
jgi:enoyl-CoA hydratase/carnithine racemase